MTQRLWHLRLFSCLLLTSSPNLASPHGLHEHSEDANSRKQRRRRCFPVSDVRCLMARNCTDDMHNSDVSSDLVKLVFDRVRFPGTASSDERGMFNKYEGDRSRYDNLSDVSNGCPPDAALCFAPADGESGLSLLFRSLDRLDAGSHVPYDVVDRATRLVGARYNPYGMGAQVWRVLVTTLRDPLSYATKWYRMRGVWDRAVDLTNATFEEWIERAPWRMNFATRVLGSKDDRRAMTRSMIHTTEGKVHGIGGGGIDHDGLDAFLRDSYMIEQNELGPERSEVYHLAIDRLRTEFVHFGIFHRLPDSWDLLAHNFCWDVRDKRHYPAANARGTDAVARFAAKYSNGGVGGDDMGLDVERAASRLRERNRLDSALLDEAEKIMDERLEAMRTDKQDGVLCNFLGKVKVTCESDANVPVDEL